MKKQKQAPTLESRVKRLEEILGITVEQVSEILSVLQDVSGDVERVVQHTMRETKG